jgi:hypothetical protein
MIHFSAKNNCKLQFLLFILLVALWGVKTPAPAQDQDNSAAANPTTFPDKIGIELDGLGDGSRSKPFVDLAKTLRPWMPATGSNPIPLDEHGWPTSDAATILFDIRPVGAWAPPIDDPAQFQPDWSGTYKMSFQGQAVIQFLQSTDIQLQNQKYDAATNITTGDIVVPKGEGLLVVSFTQTKRTATSPAGSGITNLRVIRPGYSPDTTALFTDQFVRSLKPFAVLRFMDWMDTNHNPGDYDEPGQHTLEWADRRLPVEATQVGYGNKYGVAWEYVIELAKLTGKDIWINIPIAASDDYVKNLAQLLKDNLPPTTNIYIEHSNEVWNWGFPQYSYNKHAAIDEVNHGYPNLNNDGSTDQEVWARRRHADALIKIGSIFRDTFGPDGASRIRPVFASLAGNAQTHFADVLDWVNTTYGPPKDYFYAVADAPYFNTSLAAPNADEAALVAAMRADSDSNVAARSALHSVADQYGLKYFEYEIGPDVGGGKTDNVANRILSNRDPAMKDLIIHDARDNWFAHGGDLYMYFAHCGAYSRYGCWGLSEDIEDLNTPKWQAIYELTGTSPPAAASPSPAASPSAATPPSQ